MVLSNAERQARHRARMKELRETAVTPDDVVKAARLIYDGFAAEPLNGAAPFEEWVAGLRSQGRGGGLWMEFVPTSVEPDSYDDFPPDDAALLMRVAAVARAVKFPPDAA